MNSRGKESKSVPGIEYNGGTMPSRKKRKRYRQKLAAATAKVPSSCGGWGHGLPTTLDDLVLLRRAINEDWPVPPNVRQTIVDELAGEVDPPNVRRAFAVIRTFLTMDRANLRLLSDRIDCFGADRLQWTV